jgi:hypothetical protein
VSIFVCVVCTPEGDGKRGPRNKPPISSYRILHPTPRSTDLFSLNPHPPATDASSSGASTSTNSKPCSSFPSLSLLQTSEGNSPGHSQKAASKGHACARVALYRNFESVCESSKAQPGIASPEHLDTSKRLTRPQRLRYLQRPQQVPAGGPPRFLFLQQRRQHSTRGNRRRPRRWISDGCHKPLRSAPALNAKGRVGVEGDDASWHCRFWPISGFQCTTTCLGRCVCMCGG